MPRLPSGYLQAPRLPALALLLACAAMPAHCATTNPLDYPTQPVTLIVPASAGGTTDAVARVLAEALTRRLKQPFVVENRPGANGLLGTALAARSRPNGYHLLFTYAATLLANPRLYSHPGYDPLRDFEPILQIGRGGNLLLVPAALPVHSLDGLMALVRKHPGQLNYCSWGYGSGGYLAMASLLRTAQLDMVHIPYKSSTACLRDLEGGQISAAFMDVSTAIGPVREGRLRALAVSADKRLPAWPEVPTLTESGHPFTAYSWMGLLAPAGTPEAIVRRIGRNAVDAMQDPATRLRLTPLGMADLPLSAHARFKAHLVEDMAEWGKLLDHLGTETE